MAPADRIARLEEEKTAAEASAAAQKLALDALRAAGKEAEITTQMLADLADAQNDAATAALALEKATTRDAEVMARLREEIRETAKVADKYSAALDKAREKAEAFASAGETLGTELLNLVPVLGGGVDYMDTFGGKLAAASVNAGSLAGGLGEVVGGMSAALNPTQRYTNMLSGGTEMLVAFFKNSLALGIEVQAQSAQFNKATGMAGKYDEAIMSTVRATQDAGVSVAEANEAFQSLIMTTTRFTKLAPSQQAALANTTAVLNELGVSSEVSAQGLQIMTTSLQMTAEQAESETRRIFTAAQDIGVAPAEMAADFVAMGDSLAAFGNDAVDVFIDLKETAKETGIEMSSLLGIAEQFDTFEGAAGSVGKLNALLGGPFLNTIDMISVTEPAERMLMLQQAVNDAGTSFQDMNYYQRKAIASAMGLKDAAELGALMRGELEGMGGASSGTAKKLEELKKATKFTQSLADELEATKLAFTASFEPLIKFGIFVLQGLQDLAEVMGPTGTMVVTLSLAIGLMIKGFTGLRSVITGSVQAISTSIDGMAESLENVANTLDGMSDESIEKFGEMLKETVDSTKNAGPSILAVGGAILMVGTGIAIAAIGMAQFVQSFKGLEGPQLTAATNGIIIFALAFAGFMAMLIGLVAGPQAGLVAGAVGVLLSVGGAIALIGLGIGVAAAGMSMLVSSTSAAAEDFKMISEAFEAMQGTKLIAYTAAMSATAMVGMTPAGMMIAATAAVAGGAASAAGAGGGSALPNIKVDIHGDLKKFVTSADAKYVQIKDIAPGGRTPTLANGG